MTLRTMKKDVHSRFAPALPSAAWEMVELLGKLKTGDYVNVEGFYDGIVPPSEKELEILKSLPSVEKQMEEIYGAVPCCREGENYYASLDIRLVEGQEPEDILRKVKSYIRKLGYSNVEVEMKGRVLPSKMPVDNPYVPVIAEAAREVYGDYVMYPCRPSTTPDFL